MDYKELSTPTLMAESSSRRIIKSVQKLDTSKLRSLGLESTILQAVAKLKGQTKSGNFEAKENELSSQLSPTPLIQTKHLIKNSETTSSCIVSAHCDMTDTCSNNTNNKPTTREITDYRPEVVKNVHCDTTDASSKIQTHNTNDARLQESNKVEAEVQTKSNPNEPDTRPKLISEFRRKVKPKVNLSRNASKRDIKIDQKKIDSKIPNTSSEQKKTSSKQKKLNVFDVTIPIIENTMVLEETKFEVKSHTMIKDPEIIPTSIPISLTPIDEIAENLEEQKVLFNGNPIKANINAVDTTANDSFKKEQLILTTGENVLNEACDMTESTNEIVQSTSITDTPTVSCNSNDIETTDNNDKKQSTTQPMQEDKQEIKGPIKFFDIFTRKGMVIQSPKKKTAQNVVSPGIASISQILEDEKSFSSISKYNENLTSYTKPDEDLRFELKNAIKNDPLAIILKEKEDVIVSESEKQFKNLKHKSVLNDLCDTQNIYDDNEKSNSDIVILDNNSISLKDITENDLGSNVDFFNAGKRGQDSVNIVEKAIIESTSKDSTKQMEEPSGLDIISYTTYEDVSMKDVGDEKVTHDHQKVKTIKKTFARKNSNKFESKNSGSGKKCNTQEIKENDSFSKVKNNPECTTDNETDFNIETTSETSNFNNFEVHKDNVSKLETLKSKTTKRTLRTKKFVVLEKNEKIATGNIPVVEEQKQHRESDDAKKSIEESNASKHVPQTIKSKTDNRHTKVQVSEKSSTNIKFENTDIGKEDNSFAYKQLSDDMFKPVAILGHKEISVGDKPKTIDAVNVFDAQKVQENMQKTNKNEIFSESIVSNLATIEESNIVNSLNVNLEENEQKTIEPHKETAVKNTTYDKLENFDFIGFDIHYILKYKEQLEMCLNNPSTNNIETSLEKFPCKTISNSTEKSNNTKIDDIPLVKASSSPLENTNEKPGELDNDIVKLGDNVIPKKRGRKRKIVELSQSVLDVELSITEAVPAPPKKRGRPKKNFDLSASNCNENASQIDQIDKVEPKKRGRKKKVKDNSDEFEKSQSDKFSNQRSRISTYKMLDFSEDDSTSVSEDELGDSDFTHHVSDKVVRRRTNRIESDETIESTSTSKRKSPVRKRKNVIESDDSNAVTSKEQKKRGRKRKIQNDSDPDFGAVKTLTPGRKRGPQNEFQDIDVSCGRCDVTMAGADWTSHLHVHYGCAWRKGIDPELDINDIKKLTQKMQNYLTLHKIKGVACEKCGQVKKSAGGYLVHSYVCGKSVEQAKVACKHCNAKLLPLSMDTHIAQACPVLKAISAKSKKQEQVEKDSLVDGNEMNSSGIRIKRKCMVKAEQSFSIIKANEFDPNDYIRKRSTKCLHAHKSKSGQPMKCSFCKFVTNEFTELHSHYFDNKCPNKYKCIVCEKVNDDFDEMLKHVRSHEHKLMEFDNSDSDVKQPVSDVSSEECSSGEDENEAQVTQIPGKQLQIDRKKRERIIYRMADTVVHDYYNNTIRMKYSYQDWTSEYRLENYSTESIFNDLLPTFTSSMDVSTFENYAPQIKKSHHFADSDVKSYNKEFENNEKTPSQWNTLSLFKGMTLKNSSILYCGSVSAIDWIPLPESIKQSMPEFLVVTCRRDHQFNTAICSTPSKCTIQIWEIPGIPSKNFLKPELRYTIPYDEGPIWQMRSCPSGGYSEAHNRLGLIAVSSFYGRINIYSLPLQSDNSKVIEMKPSLVLTSILSKEPNQVLRIAWSKGLGHTKLAAGCVNGLVLLWQIDPISPLLNQCVGGVKCILPTHSFFVGSAPISVLDFHCTKTDRWLMVGTQDRKLKMYDIGTSGVNEVSSTESKSRLIAGVWPIHWSSMLALTDKCLFASQPLDVGFSNEELFSYRGHCLTDLSFSEWLHITVLSTDAGDLHASYHRNWLTQIVSKQSRKLKTMLGYTGLAPINDTKRDGPSQKKGLIFCDLDKPLIVENTLATQCRSVPLGQNQITSIRHVSFCPNKRAHKYYAVGYEAGLLRIKKIPKYPYK